MQRGIVHKLENSAHLYQYCHFTICTVDHKFSENLKNGDIQLDVE